MDSIDGRSEIRLERSHMKGVIWVDGKVPLPRCVLKAVKKHWLKKAGNKGRVALQATIAEFRDHMIM